MNPIGIFKERKVPNEYIKLNNFISSQDEFFRTLWYPSYQRFGHLSETNPAISSQDLFKSKKLDQVTLSDMAVKYVIIPYDSEGEIFLSDRKYDDKLYQKNVAELNKISWLKRVEGLGKIAVYEIASPKPHFFLDGESNNVTYKRKSSTEYLVNIQTQNEGRLVFSEGYDIGWIAEDESIKYKVSSIKYGKFLNSFILPKSGSYNLKIYYEPQKVASIGYIISGLTMLSVLWAIGISLRKK